MVWLLQAKRDEALTRLLDLMQAQSLGFDSDYPRWKDAGFSKPTRCESLVRRLRDRWLGQTRTSPSTLQLAEHLLDEPRPRITTTERPTAAGGNAASRAAFDVHCPSRTHDHRVVVLGQLPDEKSHAAVFVQPRGFEVWWPQHDALQPDPRAQLAFMVLAHLGNPQGRFQENVKLPHDFDVLVYAVRKPWRDRADPLSLTTIEARLHELGIVAGPLRRRIRRLRGFEDVRITHRGGRLPVFDGSLLRCRAPVSITWSGLKDALLEIRLAYRDFEYTVSKARSGVKLTLPHCRQPKNQIRLDEAGKVYRVRLYPPKRTFVDAQYEWWIDVT
jgi:hypothetical protein